MSVGKEFGASLVWWRGEVDDKACNVVKSYRKPVTVSPSYKLHLIPNYQKGSIWSLQHLFQHLYRMEMKKNWTEAPPWISQWELDNCITICSCEQSLKPDFTISCNFIEQQIFTLHWCHLSFLACTTVSGSFGLI